MGEATVLARDDHGWQLLALTREDEDRVDDGVPCPLSLVVVRRPDGRVLLGRNRWRGTWELPGGVRDDGESARAAARRELLEETALDLDVAWAGVASFALVRDGRPEHRERGAVYVASAPASADPRPADGELTGVVWADLTSAPPPGTAPIDWAIALWAPPTAG